MISGKHTRVLPGDTMTVQNRWWSPVTTLGCCLAMSRERYDVRLFLVGKNRRSWTCKLQKSDIAAGLRKQAVHKITHFRFKNSETMVLLLLRWRCRTAPFAGYVSGSKWWIWCSSRVKICDRKQAWSTSMWWRKIGQHLVYMKEEMKFVTQKENEKLQV